MQDNVRLNAFQALVRHEAAKLSVKAYGTSKGFCLRVGDALLGTETGALRTFKNLTTLARFAVAQRITILALDLGTMPTRKRPQTKPAAVAAAIAPPPRVAKKATGRPRRVAKKVPAKAASKRARKAVAA